MGTKQNNSNTFETKVFGFRYHFFFNFVCLQVDIAVVAALVVDGHDILLVAAVRRYNHRLVVVD